MSKSNKKLTTEEWINLCIRVHGNKYNYSKSNYVNSKTLITIGCPVHGDINVNPNRHKNGSGCRKCSAKASTSFEKLDKTTFIKDAIKTHNNKYDYSKVEDFKTSHEKVSIICPVHGIFKQRVYTHRDGGGCEKCSYVERGLKGRVSAEEFKTRAAKIHRNKYNYDLVDFNILSSTVTIMCPHHGKFTQKAKDHLNGGCLSCGKITAAYSFKKDKNYTDISQNIRSGVYLLEFEDFYKIGIAKNIRHRINLISSRLKLSRNPNTIMYKEMSLFDAVNIENSLHQKYDGYRFTYKDYFEGMTECFNLNLPVQEIKDYLKQLS